MYRFRGLREETMSICDDVEDTERDDALSNLQQLSHFDDRTVQFIEVNRYACISVKVYYVYC